MSISYNNIHYTTSTVCVCTSNIYIYIYIYIYVCVCVCVCIYICLCIYAYIYMCVCVCVKKLSQCGKLNWHVSLKDSFFKTEIYFTKTRSECDKGEGNVHLSILLLSIDLFCCKIKFDFGRSCYCIKACQFNFLNSRIFFMTDFYYKPYIYLCMYVYIYIYIFTRTHTHTHIYIHIYIYNYTNMQTIYDEKIHLLCDVKKKKEVVYLIFHHFPIP